MKLFSHTHTVFRAARHNLRSIKFANLFVAELRIGREKERNGGGVCVRVCVCRRDTVLIN